MAKKITEENLRKYAEDQLESAASLVVAGFMDPKTAKGHINELFLLSGTFGLGLQEKAREILKEIDG